MSPHGAEHRFDSGAETHDSAVLSDVNQFHMYIVKIDEWRTARMTAQELAAWCRENNWDENNELSDEYLINEAVECEIAEQLQQFSPAQEAKERALFVAFYYWQVGHNDATLWQTFDKVYDMAGEFVQTYSPDDTWEDRSFEDYMLEFIRTRVN